MVEQLGLAMIQSSAVSTSALISGTTSFLSGSIRQQEELSTTRQPAAAKRGASSREAAAPAEKIASDGRRAMASSALTTVQGSPRKTTVFPTDRSEATGISSSTGNCLSSRTWIIRVPTSPVAPTTATIIGQSFMPRPALPCLPPSFAATDAFDNQRLPQVDPPSQRGDQLA